MTRMVAAGPIHQVFGHRFPSGTDWGLVSLRMPVDDIAARFGWTVERWEEDGLGPATGLLVELPSGRVVLLRELQHVRKYYGEEGPTVHVDAGDLAAFGIEALVAEILEGLGMSRDLVKWIAPTEAQRAAADFVARRRATHADPPES